MPGLAAFLRTGVAFRNATSASPWTGPSIASVLTGLLPTRHGASEFGDAFRLVDAVPTLAEILGKAGWRPGAFTGGAWVSAETGMLQGFLVEPSNRFSFGAGTKGLLEVHARGEIWPPWVLFLHTYEAHDPYLSPPQSPGQPPIPDPPGLDLAAIDREAATGKVGPLARRFLLDPASRAPVFEREGRDARMRLVMRYFEQGFRSDPDGPALARDARAAYDEGVRRLDAALMSYLGPADQAGYLANTVVVILSDHGEAFGEHGSLHHGRSLYDELVRVPLFVRAPGWPAGVVVDEPCSLLDVAPTVLRLLGLPEPEGGDGHDLAPLVTGGQGAPALSEERRTSAATGLDVDEDLVCVRDARWKLIVVHDRRTGSVREEVYDLANDPGEKSSLPPPDPASWTPAFRAAAASVRARFAAR